MTTTRARTLPALALLVLAGAVVLLLNTSTAGAADAPTEDDTARLLGYMWADGAYENGTWDISGPSGAANLIEELVERHDGSWIDRRKLVFTLPAPYDWADWKDGLPNDNAAVIAAVDNPNFTAAVIEAEGTVTGQIYDQSRCCTPGFTEGRLTALAAHLRDSGYPTADVVYFGNVDSGKVVVDEADWPALRGNNMFVCPLGDAAIRVAGGTDHQTYGNIPWIDANSDWATVVRTECSPGQSVPTPQPLTGTCSVTLDANGDVRVDWSFTLGDAVIRRDGKYRDVVSGRDGFWAATEPTGEWSYAVRLQAFGTQSETQCGTITVGGDDGGGDPGDGGETPPCRIATVAAGVLIEWDDFGKSSYSIRRNDKWVASSGERSVTVAGTTADVWTIRYRDNGVKINVACTEDDNGNPPPPPPPPAEDDCTVTQTADGIRLEWTPVAGVSTYQIRLNGKWLATVQGTMQFDHAGGSPDDTYGVRHRENGVKITRACV